MKRTEQIKIRVNKILERTKSNAVEISCNLSDKELMELSKYFQISKTGGTGLFGYIKFGSKIK